MEDDKTFACAVKALILNSGRALLVKRSDVAKGDHGYWEFPGGRVEFGESPRDALLREVKEETGLDVIIDGPLSTWTFYKTENLQVIGITSLCLAKEAIIHLSEEHVQYEWVLPDRIREYDTVHGMASEIEGWDWQAILARD